MVEMKRDLESIFKRLKTIKQKLNKQMPEAYTAAVGCQEGVKEEEDDEYDAAIKERKIQQQLAAATLEDAKIAKDACDVKSSNWMYNYINKHLQTVTHLLRF